MMGCTYHHAVFIALSVYLEVVIQRFDRSKHLKCISAQPRRFTGKEDWNSVVLAVFQCFTQHRMLIILFNALDVFVKYNTADITPLILCIAC